MPSLDRTYEELKLSHEFLCVSKTNRLDRTYEELKLAVSVPIPAHVTTGLDRTYEELKQGRWYIYTFVFSSLDRTYEELKLRLFQNRGETNLLSGSYL